MREVRRNFMVGLTSILALAGLATMLLLFGELDRWIIPRYEIKLRINSAAGLTAGNQVLLDGVRVGVVKAVNVETDPGFPPVRVDCLIDKSVYIPIGTVPRIEVAWIGGGATLWLTSPPPEPGVPVQYLPQDGSAVIVGTYKPLIEQLTEALDQRMAPLLDSLRGFQGLGDNLNELVRSQSSEELSGGAAPNIHTAAVRLNAALADAQEAMKLAKEWLGDAQLREDAKSAVAKAGLLIDTATDALQRYAKLADTLRDQAGDVTAKLLPVMDQMSATLDEVRRLALLANSGKGTVAQLLNNPDLYNSLNDAAVRLERALLDAQLLIQKIKAEGLPVNF